MCPAADCFPVVRETPQKWVKNLLAVDPRTIGQPPAATANTAAEPTAGTAPPACRGANHQADPEEQVRKVRREASPQRITATSPPPAKKQKVKTVTKLKTVPKPKTVAKPKAVPKPKAKAKKGKPKAKAETAKPKAKPKSGKPKAKAKTALKGTAKCGLKRTTWTSRPSQPPSLPKARKFSPIHFGPCTIYHGGQQRKYRLKESYASRRTTSFNDWAKMMAYIQTL